MRRREKKVRFILWMLFFSILIGIALSLYFDAGQNISTWKGFLRNIINSIILGGSLWYGNYLIANYFEIKKKWDSPNIIGVIYHVLVALLFSITVMLLFYLYLWFIRMGKPDLHHFFDHFKYSFFVFLAITAIITLFFYSRGYFMAWKQSLVMQEQLKRETLQLQYEALKNQVNPHFLFNSLNVLTSLIEKDTKASVNYVKQLSEVFRYVLDQNTNELVPINDELKFLESFIFLNKIRYGDNITFTINIFNRDFWIVPVSLQILIENAIKHNEISAEKPLHIEITEENEYVEVKNNIQPRNYLPESNQLGLKNLQFQYSYLTQKSPEIVQNSQVFSVKLPKITKENEGINH